MRRNIVVGKHRLVASTNRAASWITLFSALAVFVMACLATPPEAVAQPGTRVVWVWKKVVDCPDPCPTKTACTFEVRFAYNERRLPGGTIFVDAFDVEFRKAADDDCEAQFERGRGTFTWTCGTTNCELTAANVRQCPCGAEIQFQDLNATDGQTCRCPPAPPESGMPGPPTCGDPVSIDVICPAGIPQFEIDATHDLIGVLL